jgi:hypothetical protein
MATKTNFLSTINGFITALITQAKVRSAFSTVSDELYPTSVIDTQVTETYTNKSSTNITYSIRIVKSGNIAHISGQITNVTGVFLNPQYIFTWKDTEFRPKSIVNNLLFKAENSTSSVRLNLTDAGVQIVTQMANQGFSFDFKTYITQD